MTTQKIEDGLYIEGILQTTWAKSGIVLKVWTLEWYKFFSNTEENRETYPGYDKVEFGEIKTLRNFYIVSYNGGEPLPYEECGNVKIVPCTIKSQSGKSTWNYIEFIKTEESISFGEIF